MRLKIEIGKRFGKLKVINELDGIRNPSGQINRVFKCVCDCGNIKNVRLAHLNHGKTISCGCYRRLINKPKYTKDEKYIIRIHKAIRDRCSPNAIDSHIYFKRGINVCKQWLDDPQSFVDWGLKMGLKKGLHIDRIDNYKGYSPDNCRVVTPKENANNRRNTFYVKYKGVEYAFMFLLDKLNISNYESTIRLRIKRGWSVDKAFDTPIRKGNYKKIKQLDKGTSRPTS